MRQVKSNTGDEVQRFNRVKDGQNEKEGAVGCYGGSDVWVHLKAQGDLLIFRKAGWEAEGRRGLIWAVTMTMINGLGKSAMEIRKTPALPCMSSTQLKQDAGAGSAQCASSGGRRLHFATASSLLCCWKATNTRTSLSIPNEEADSRLFEPDSCCALTDCDCSKMWCEANTTAMLRVDYCKVINQINAWSSPDVFQCDIICVKQSVTVQTSFMFIHSCSKLHFYMVYLLFSD